MVVSTSGFPSKSTVQSGTLYTTDSEGNVEINGIGSVSRGQTAYVGMLAYENADGSGSESSLAKSRDTFTKDESPKFNWIELEKVEDDGTDDTYFVDWGVNASVGQCASGWRVKVFCYRNNGYATQSTFCPDAAPVQIVASGEGDGSSDTHHVRLELYQELIAHAGNREYENRESGDVQSSATGGSGPSNLSVAFDGADCEMDLAWDPDTTNNQDIYRCSGGDCDPTVDGSVITTVSAGTSSHNDDVTGVSQGTTLNYEVQSTAGTSNTDGAFRGKC